MPQEEERPVVTLLKGSLLVSLRPSRMPGPLRRGKAHHRRIGGTAHPALEFPWETSIAPQTDTTESESVPRGPGPLRGGAQEEDAQRRPSWWPESVGDSD